MIAVKGNATGGNVIATWLYRDYSKCGLRANRERLPPDARMSLVRARGRVESNKKTLERGLQGRVNRRKWTGNRCLAAQYLLPRKGGP